MMNVRLEWAKCGFIDYNFFFYCVECGTKCNQQGVWRKNRCPVCHNKLRTTSHRNGRNNKETKRY